MTKRFVCKVADVPQNGLKEVEAEGGLKLLVASSGGEFYGYQAQCPHQDVALCEGLYDGSVLTCHMHLWQWDIRTGAPIGLAESPLQCYPIAVEGDALVLGPQPSALDVGELFRGLAADTLAKLAALAASESHPAGAVLYSPGHAAEDIYVLDSGRVEFTIGRGEGAAPDGFMLKKGETFGWAALLEGYPKRIA
ncbi:MAG TPA: Rieske 2Fe-2S domain-containing protein, partial [Burkholderiales bacterium]|nr:Rieske 2Fe-2S domain-containing protein [Burkholderiales bacterium]